jgi:GTPase SAR1 family protein
MISLIKKKNIIILCFFIRNLNSLPEISKEIIEKENAILRDTFTINSL